MNPNSKMRSVQVALDKAGMFTSTLCAIHCTVLPVLLSISTFSGLVFLDDPAIENIILSGSIALGVSSMLPAYVRTHRKLTAVGILLFGFLFIIMAKVADDITFEIIFISVGALMIAGAHFLNNKLCANAHHH